MRPLRIVVADDEPAVRQFLVRLLISLGHHVVAVAEDGRQLVEHCHQFLPDLVITDITMPELSGIDAMAELNSERHVPTVLVTGCQDVQDKPSYIVACLHKPVSSADIQAAITLAAVSLISAIDEGA